MCKVSKVKWKVHQDTIISLKLTVTATLEMKKHQNIVCYLYIYFNIYMFVWECLCLSCLHHTRAWACVYERERECKMSEGRKFVTLPFFYAVQVRIPGVQWCQKPREGTILNDEIWCSQKQSVWNDRHTAGHTAGHTAPRLTLHVLTGCELWLLWTLPPSQTGVTNNR